MNTIKLSSINKIPQPWVLKPKNKFWANWSQMINQAIGPELSLCFSQTRPHFIQNYMVNPMKLQNSIITKGSGAQKQVLGHLSQNDLPSNNS